MDGRQSTAIGTAFVPQSDSVPPKKVKVFNIWLQFSKVYEISGRIFVNI